MFYPIVVALVALAFSSLLLRQFLLRRRPYQLVWCIAMTMGCLAAIFFVLFLGENRNELFFRLYYLFGALLMAPYLGLGTVFLLAPVKAARIVALTLIAASVIGTVLLLTATVDTHALQGSNVEAGTKVISGPAIVFIAVMNTFGAIAVVGGALFSAWRLRRKQGPAHLLAANALIATGTILASLAGALARLSGNGAAFWALLSLGFAVLFSGFLLTRSPIRAQLRRPAETKAG
jgi:hypothetical protein